MPHPIKPPSATTATTLPPATVAHPHPDFHAEALALVGGNLPLAVRVSHALAEAKLGGLREALSVCLPGTSHTIIPKILSSWLRTMQTRTTNVRSYTIKTINIFNLNTWYNTMQNCKPTIYSFWENNPIFMEFTLWRY
jgi:hypothetical protein